MDSDDDMHDANYSDSLDNDYYSGDNGIGSDGDGGFEFDNSDDSDDSISRHRQQSLLRLFGRQSLLRLFGRQRRTSISAASTATVQHYNSLSPAPTRPSTSTATPAAETVRLQPFSASFGLVVQSISSRTIQPVSAPNSNKTSSFGSSTASLQQVQQVQQTTPFPGFPVQGLSRHILEELEEAFPDEVEAYREIRTTSAAAFAAHKLVLAARSPVFRAQLFGPMKDQNTQCIRIEDMEAPVFKV